MPVTHRTKLTIRALWQSKNGEVEKRNHRSVPRTPSSPRIPARLPGSRQSEWPCTTLPPTRNRRRFWSSSEWRRRTRCSLTRTSRPGWPLSEPWRRINRNFKHTVVEKHRKSWIMDTEGKRISGKLRWDLCINGWISAIILKITSLTP